jgi:predicted nucleic acid-binding protein
MQVIDTVVLLAYLDKKDPRHEKAVEYVFDIGLRRDLFVPSVTLLELDLELKAHRVQDETRDSTHSRLARLIPENRVVPLTSAMLGRATKLSKVANWKSSYFDTLIAATGLEFGADSAITTDRKFARLGIKPVF